VTTGTGRRQERGQRRIETILDAASAVFSESGYDAATTNGIAAAAGISPGSLYQFFPNKQAIADALIERYVTQLRTLNRQSQDPRLEQLAVEQRIDRIVDAVVDFNRAHPAVNALLAGAAISPELAATTGALQDELCSRLEPLVAAAAPGLAPRQQHRCAEMTTQIIKAVMPMVLSASPRERPAVVRELKRALLSYLTALGE
jgi:AcrR family transcriptional regulator